METEQEKSDRIMSAQRSRLENAQQIVRDTGKTIYEALDSLGAPVPKEFLATKWSGGGPSLVREDGWTSHDLVPQMLHAPESVLAVGEENERAWMEISGYDDPHFDADRVAFAGSKTDTASVLLQSSFDTIGGALLMPGEQAEYEASLISGVPPSWMDDLLNALEGAEDMSPYALLAALLPLVLTWLGFSAAAIALVMGGLAIFLLVKGQKKDALYFGRRLIGTGTEGSYTPMGNKNLMAWR